MQSVSSCPQRVWQPGVCIITYAYMHTCTHTCSQSHHAASVCGYQAYKYICIPAHTCTHTYMHTCIHTCSQSHLCVAIRHLNTYAYLHIHVHIHAYMYTYMQLVSSYINTYTYMCIHVYIHAVSFIMPPACVAASSKAANAVGKMPACTWNGKCTNVRNTFIHTYKHTCVYTYVRTNILTYTHTYVVHAIGTANAKMWKIHIHVHTHIHTYN